MCKYCVARRCCLASIHLLLTASLIPEELIQGTLQLLAPLQPFSFPCHLIQLQNPTCAADITLLFFIMASTAVLFLRFASTSIIFFTMACVLVGLHGLLKSTEALLYELKQLSLALLLKAQLSFTVEIQYTQNQDDVLSSVVNASAL